MWGDEAIPVEFYDTEALKMVRSVNEWDEGTSPRMDLVAPAIPWAWVAFVAAFVLFMSVPLLSLFASTSVGQGFARVSPWVYVPYGVGVLGLMWIEEKIRRWTLVTQVVSIAEKREEAGQEFRGFTVLGITLPFKAWLWLNRAVSLAGHADLITTGMFTAKVIATCNAPHAGSDDGIEYVWRRTMQDSIGVSVLGSLGFDHLAIACWLLILLQFVYAWGTAAGRQRLLWLEDDGGRDVTYDLIPGIRFYSTPFLDVTSHGCALASLSEVCRMASVTSNYTDTYMRGRNTVYSHYHVAEFQRSVIRFGVFTVLESGFQLNLQSSGLAISKALDLNHHVDKMVLISILFGVLMGLYNLQLSASRIWSLSKLTIEYDPAFEDNINQDTKLRNRMTVVFIIEVCVFSLALTRAMTQTYMAVWVCPYGMHNIGVGCVNPWAV